MQHVRLGASPTWSHMLGLTGVVPPSLLTSFVNINAGMCMLALACVLRSHPDVTLSGRWQP